MMKIVQYPHGVGAKDPDVMLSGHPGDFILEIRAMPVGVGKTLTDDEGAPGCPSGCIRQSAG